MRRALALVALATTSMVSLAFLVPLLLVVQQIARDRALGDAEQQADAIVPVLSITTDPAIIGRAVATSTAGSRGALAVHLPNRRVVGTSRANAADLAKAQKTGRSLTDDVPGGTVYLQTTALIQGRAVIEVFVTEKELSRGVAVGWWGLSAVALALMLGSVVVSDRLAGSIVGATRGLAITAREFGGGELRARVNPGGPPELVEAGTAFNTMADRVVQLLDAERELAADLSHRLRTPLTALRLDAEALDDGADSTRIRTAIDALESEIDDIITTARRPLSERRAETSDLAEVVRERLEFWSALAEDEGREWRHTGDDTPRVVAVARAELVAVLDVLLGNVFRHTPHGTPFALTVLGLPGRVALVVEDGGPGILHPRRAVRRGSSGGGSTGLGLDIARRVAEENNGLLRIDRGELGGARLRLELPLTSDGEKPWPMVGRSRRVTQYGTADRRAPTPPASEG